MAEVNSENLYTKITACEQVEIKNDLLKFIHSICIGEFSSPAHIQTLIPVVETVAKFFD